MGVKRYNFIYLGRIKNMWNIVFLIIFVYSIFVLIICLFFIVGVKFD